MVFRLAHISDLHLGPLPAVKRRELISKRITGYVNFRRNRSNAGQPEVTERITSFLKTLNPDHTAITGDLINLGLDLEIENARNWLEELGDPERFTVVLGNHDAYVRGARDKAMKAWQEWITGDSGDKVQSQRDYPILRRRGPVSIIGCNSAHASAPFLATGQFRKPQAGRLRNLIEAESGLGQFVVILIHHAPFPRATARHKRLVGLSNFTKAIRECGGDLILHGHTHLASETWLEGPDKPVPVICVPAAYQWPGHHRPPAGINLFTIEHVGGEPNIVLQRYSHEGPSGEEIVLVEEKELRPVGKL